jgi:hypothetical protein
MKLTAELKLVWYFWSENWRLLVWLNKKLGDLASIREVSSMSEANQTAAAKFEATVTAQHQQHFGGDHPGPQRGGQCEAEGLAERRLLTRLGPVNLSEIKFHCNACRRSFFPSA